MGAQIDEPQRISEGILSNSWPNLLRSLDLQLYKYQSTGLENGDAPSNTKSADVSEGVLANRYM